MKISILMPDFPYPKRVNIRGSRRYIENLAISLKEMGNDVKIITTLDHGYKKYDYYNGIPIHRVVDSKFLFGKYGKILYLNYITFGLNLLKRKNFRFYCDSDIIILPIAFLFTRFFKIKKIPVISVCFHYNIIKSLKNYLTTPFLHNMRKHQFKIHKNVLTISNSSKNDIIKHYGIIKKYVKVIPAGININKFNPDNFSKEIRDKFGNKILLWSGSIVERKKLPVLLKAMPHVINEFPDTNLIIIGKGPLLSYCKQLSNSLGIQKYISFLGFVEDNELIKYYASSDIYVFTSEHEGFGIVILEAMASGIPVICTDKPPMSEIIENGGKTFRLNDSKDLAKKIIKLLNNREELKEYSKNALQIAKKYEWENIAKAYIEYIKEMKI